MGIYDQTYKTIINRLLPPDKRGKGIIAYLTDLLSPLQQVHDDVFVDGNLSGGVVYRTDTLQKAHYNAQKIVFEKVLNKRFSVTSAPFIYIDLIRNAAQFNYFFNESEARPVYMYNEGELPDQPLYMWNESEIIPNYSFIIYVPTALWTTLGANDTIREGYVRAVADSYNIDGIGYLILEY